MVVSPELCRHRDLRARDAALADGPAYHILDAVDRCGVEEAVTVVEGKNQRFLEGSLVFGAYLTLPSAKTKGWERVAFAKREQTMLDTDMLDHDENNNNTAYHC